MRITMGRHLIQWGLRSLAVYFMAVLIAGCFVAIFPGAVSEAASTHAPTATMPMILMNGANAVGRTALAIAPTYANPPQRVVWLEGVQCRDTNFPNVAAHAWWYSFYPGISPWGLLDVAAWRLPDDGHPYYARFHFDLPEAGVYTLYWRGRWPDFYASPISWQINNGPRHDDPPAGHRLPEGQSYSANVLASTFREGLALVRLGTFHGHAGANTVTIRVRKFAHVGAERFYFQEIDSLLISRSQMTPLPSRMSLLQGLKPPPFKFNLDPKKPTAPGYDITLPAVFRWWPPYHGLWADYRTLQLVMRVSGRTNQFACLLRCYYDGAHFRDVSIHVPAKDVNKWIALRYNLDDIFHGVSRRDIQGLHLFTFSQWFSEPTDVRVQIKDLNLTEPEASTKSATLELPPQGAPPPTPAELRAAEKTPLPRVLPMWPPTAHSRVTGAITPLAQLLRPLYVFPFFELGGRPFVARPASPPQAVLRTITAGALRVALNGSTGGFQSIKLKGQDKTWTLLNGVAPPILQVGFLRPGPDRPLQRGQWQKAWRAGGLWTPAGGTWTRDAHGWVFHAGDNRLRATIHYEPDAAHQEVRCWATIHNLTRRRPVFMVSLGPLDGIALPGGAKKTTYFLGTRHFSPTGSSPCFSAAQASSPYLSLLTGTFFTHDWACVFDGTVSLHLMWQDQRLLDTLASFDRLPSGAVIGLAKFPKIKPGQSWTTPVFIVGADDTGTWYRAADRFSHWFWSWAKRPVYPKWFRAAGGASNGWIGPLVFTPPSALIPGNHQSVIDYNRSLYTQLKRMTGLNLRTETYDWIPGYASWVPYSYELPIQPLQRVRTVVNALHRDGGRVAFYTNIYEFSRVIPAYEVYGKKLGAICADGYPLYFEDPSNKDPIVVAYPDAAWGEHFWRAVHNVIALDRPDIWYLDQLGSGPLMLDFRPGAKNYGHWIRSQGRFVRVLMKHLRRTNPKIVVWGETDNLAAQLDGVISLYSSCTPLEQAVFRYTFPWIHKLEGYNHPADPLGSAVTAWLVGNPMCVDFSQVKMLKPLQRHWLKHIVLTKRKFDPLLYAARFRYNLGLRTTGGAQATAFVTKTGGLLICFVNPSTQEQRLAIRTGALVPTTIGTTINQCRLLTLRRNEPVKFTDSQGLVSTSLPPHSVGLLQLNDRK